MKNSMALGGIFKWSFAITKEEWKERAENAEEKLADFKAEIYEKEVIQILKSDLKQVQKDLEVEQAKNEILERTNIMLANTMRVEIIKDNRKK